MTRDAPKPPRPSKVLKRKEIASVAVGLGRSHLAAQRPDRFLQGIMTAIIRGELQYSRLPFAFAIRGVPEAFSF